MWLGGRAQTGARCRQFSFKGASVFCALPDASLCCTRYCSEASKQTRLNKFSGSAAISSADYFGDGDGGPRSQPSGDMDLSAADLVNRLSVQAQQDLASMKQMGSKLLGLGSKLMSDLGRGY